MHNIKLKIIQNKNSINIKKKNPLEKLTDFKGSDYIVKQQM